MLFLERTSTKFSTSQVDRVIEKIIPKPYPVKVTEVKEVKVCYKTLYSGSAFINTNNINDNIVYMVYGFKIRLILI